MKLYGLILDGTKKVGTFDASDTKLGVMRNLRIFRHLVINGVAKGKYHFIWAEIDSSGDWEEITRIENDLGFKQLIFTDVRNSIPLEDGEFLQFEKVLF